MHILAFVAISWPHKVLIFIGPTTGSGVGLISMVAETVTLLDSVVFLRSSVLLIDEALRKPGVVGHPAGVDRPVGPELAVTEADNFLNEGVLVSLEVVDFG